MVDAIVSHILEQLTSLAAKEATEQVRLVTGVGKEVNKLTSNLGAIKVVLNDAEKRQVKEETVRHWLDELKDVSYDMEDVLDEWNTARLKLQIEGVDDQENTLVPRKKVCSCFPAYCFRFKQVFLRRDIALRIKEINVTLDDIARRKDMFNFVNVIKSNEIPDERVQSIPSIDETEIFGREKEKNDLINKLCESSEKQKNLHVISLVGMGGIGKTTLAQLAYNNVDVKKKFDKRIWVCVSDPFDELRIARAIIEALKGSSTYLVEFTSLMQHIEEYVEGKKFLLVLDDVWNEDYTKWEPFYNCLKNGHPGSKILITTRKDTVARMMGSIDVISVNGLSEKKCWLLFKQLAFFGKSPEKCEKLAKIGQKIVEKCKGLPLAAKTIGSLMQTKDTEEEWASVLESDIWELEEVEKGLLALLLLSYNELPSMVKQCFSYCAVFPKDYDIEKDTLIKLWMAQGYLSVKENREMEVIGQEYFNILASRSFFQQFERDVDGEIISCKIHDIVHDFAQFLRRNECFSLKFHAGEEFFINSLGEKVRHLMLNIDDGDSFSLSICSFKKLRSLLIEGANYRYSQYNYARSSEVLPQLFDGLTCLRVLDFNGGYFIYEIPTNIDKLIHLRYLNLSGQMIETLPESLCELYNLHLLNITSCFELKELPQGIGKLINMRYLLNEDTRSLRYMPIEIGRLTSLRTVGKFVVGGSGSGGVNGCSLESLKNLNLLQKCYIWGLGNVSNVVEARRSELEKKKKLLHLGLHFDSRDDGMRRKNEEDEQILEALQPPPNLKILEMGKYRGNNIFPKHWMMSLTNLTFLSLEHCRNCKHLPPLGKLPSLEVLHIIALHSVKRLGNEFLGIESDTDDSASSVIAFPKLKSLYMVNMMELEELDYEIPFLRKGNTSIMPCLSSLNVKNCPKLKALRISGCANVLGRRMCWFYDPIGTNLSNWREIKTSELEETEKTPHMEIWFDGIAEERRKNEKDEQLLEALRPFSNLKVLKVSAYRGNNVFPKHWIITLTNLRSLRLEDCINCEHLPPLGKLPSLEILHILALHSVKRVGNEFLGIESENDSASSVIAFPKLNSLHMVEMKELEEWDYEIPFLRKRKISIMPCLSSLNVENCPKLKTLPDCLLRTRTLEKLRIFGCPNILKRGMDYDKSSGLIQ